MRRPASAPAPAPAPACSPPPQAATSASAFGRPIPYGKEAASTIPPGYQLPFGEALRLASEHMVTRWATPAWAYSLPIPAVQRLLLRTRLSYTELEGHLRQLIADSRASVGAERTTDGTKKALGDDLLRRLVESNALEGDPAKRLTDDELLSNVFVRPPSPSVCLAHPSR